MFGVVNIRCSFPIAEREECKTGLHSGTGLRSVVFEAMDQPGLDGHSEGVVNIEVTGARPLPLHEPVCIL